MTVKMVPIATTMSTSTNEKPLALRRCPLRVPLSLSIPGVLIVSSILPTLVLPGPSSGVLTLDRPTARPA